MTTAAALGLTGATTGWQDVGAWGKQARQQVREFEDWTIDGIPLRRLLAARSLQEMTPLCAAWPWPEDAVMHLETLLGQRPDGDFDDGRVALLRCPIDNDLGCAALSMSLHIADAEVSWNDLGWQVNYQPFDPAEDRLTPARSLTFDRLQYETVVRGALDRYRVHAEQQAAEQPAGRRRWRLRG